VVIERLEVDHLLIFDRAASLAAAGGSTERAQDSFLYSL